MKSIGFVSARSGVGTTTLVSHLAWMFAERGQRVLAVDLDPQAGLSTLMLGEERLEALWRERATLADGVVPLFAHGAEVVPAHVESVTGQLHLLVGDARMGRFEELLADSWSRSLDGDEAALRATTALHRVIREAAERVGAAVVLVDVGPSLGALTRAGLLACDRLVIPIAPDMASQRAVETLGPLLRAWREGWATRRTMSSHAATDLPEGALTPMGYVLLIFGARGHRMGHLYWPWRNRAPAVYRQAILDEHDDSQVPALDADPHRLASLVHWVGLGPLAAAAQKPMFLLTRADGILGAYVDAVRSCSREVLALAQRLGASVGVEVE